MPDQPPPKKRPQQRLGPFTLLDEQPTEGPVREFRGRYEPAANDAPVPLDPERIVLVKVLRDSAARDPKAMAHFSREAELSMMIDHPSVVRGLTRGTTGGRMWMAQEAIDGVSLRTVLRVARREGLRMRPEVALVVALDSLAGLAAAHGIVDGRGRPQGLIHRHLHPGVILLDALGTSHVTGFGGALLSVREEPDPDHAGGEPGWLAPEQARGEQLTQGVDVYAAGLLLFESLTGRVAFDVEGYPDSAMREAHAHNRRAAWPRNLDVPLDVIQLVDQATADTPEDRPPDATTLFALVEGLIPEPEEARARLAMVVRDLTAPSDLADAA